MICPVLPKGVGRRVAQGIDSGRRDVFNSRESCRTDVIDNVLCRVREKLLKFIDTE
nr:MAG TPA: hypothetical protein [Caudoviricetes sp.]